MKNMKEEVGKRIESIRKELKLTKEKFAKKIGVSGQFLGMVEKGKSSLSYEKLEKLCDLTGYSADYILFGKDDRIRRETKQVLSGFNDRQIQQACGIISQIATFIKNSDIA